MYNLHHILLKHILVFDIIFLDLSGVTIFVSLECKSVHHLKVKSFGALTILVILIDVNFSKNIIMTSFKFTGIQLIFYSKYLCNV